VATFQENFSNILEDKLTAGQSGRQPWPERPVRIFCLDESRFGLLPIQRRRLTFTGVKPLGTVQYRFENFYVYGAVEPTTGESFFLELPYLNSTNFQIFLNEFSLGYPETLNLVLMDNGSCHTAKSLVIPDNVVCLFLPPYSPELNPIERLWQDVKDQLAWVLAGTLAELEHHVEMIITHYAQAAIRSLTSYPYFVDAVHAVGS
jgi:DDE superfamily endonuclease